MQIKFNSIVKNNNGKTKIFVWAENKESAINNICKLENCTREDILKIEIVKPSISQIKELTKESAPYFFSSKTMKFFGQRMKDFKVYREGEMFRIYAPHKHGATERIFNPYTNELQFIES